MRKHLPVWPDGKDHGSLGEEGMYYADQIHAEFENPRQDVLVLRRKYQTPSVDTSALEPHNAHSWYEAANQAMPMVVPTHAPTAAPGTPGPHSAKTTEVG